MGIASITLFYFGRTVETCPKNVDKIYYNACKNFENIKNTNYKHFSLIRNLFMNYEIRADLVKWV